MWAMSLLGRWSWMKNGLRKPWDAVVWLIHWILLTDVMGSGGGAFWGELDGENRGLKLMFVSLKHAQRAS